MFGLNSISKIASLAKNALPDSVKNLVSSNDKSPTNKENRNVLTAAMKAYTKLEVAKAQKKGFFERWRLALKSFGEEMGWIEKKKQEVSEKAKKALEGEGISVVKKGLGLDEDGQKNKEFNTFLAAGMKNLKEMKDADKAAAGFEVLSKAVSGDDVEIADENAKAMGGVILKTLTDLKSGLSKSEFADKLKNLEKVLSKSKYPLSKVLKTSLDLSGLKGKLGMVKMVGVGTAVGMIKGEYLKHTSKANVELALEKLANITTSNDKKIDTADLAELVYLIDDKDYKALIGLLYGKNESLKKAA